MQNENIITELKMLDDKEINLESIKKFAKEVMEAKIKWEEDEDTDHYAYETIMEAVYGKQYWERLKQNK